MSTSDELLTILACSVTGERLRLMAPDEVSSLNEAIAAREVSKRGGALAIDPLDAGLVADAAKVVYPIVNDLPYLLPEDGIVVPS